MTTDELQTRYAHWRALEEIATRDYGPADELAAYYRRKRESVEYIADIVGISVRHLAGDSYGRPDCFGGRVESA